MRALLSTNLITKDSVVKEQAIPPTPSVKGTYKLGKKNLGKQVNISEAGGCLHL